MVRIVCLLPGLTQLLYHLRLGSELAGRGAECLVPEPVASLPVAGRLLAFDEEGAPGASPLVDVPHAGREHLARYAADRAALAALGADVVLTEEVCPICLGAYRPVGPHLLEAGVSLGGRRVRVISYRPTRLIDAVDDIVALAALFGCQEQAERLQKQRGARLLALRMHVARFIVRAGATRPRVAVLEWPASMESFRLQALGRWVPDMVDAAGGLPVLAEAGERDRLVALEDLMAACPSFVIAGRRGSPLERVARDLADAAQEGDASPLEPLQRMGAAVWVADFDWLLAFPGPGLVGGVEMLIRIILPAALGANGVPPPADLARPL